MLITKASVSQDLVNIFTLPNPKYHELVRLDKKTWNTPETKSVISGPHMPPGTAYWAARLGKKLDTSPKFTGTLLFSKTPTPRPYQSSAIDGLCSVRHALLEAPTGAGKTFISTAITHKLRAKTLCITSSKEILGQFVDAYSEFLGYECGQYYSSKKDLRPITITTYNSFLLHFDEFVKYGFDVMIIDEADLFTTQPRIKAMSSFPAHRKYAVTATPKVPKYDALIKGVPLMERLWGYKVSIKIDDQTDILKDIVLKKYDKTYVDEYGLAIIPKDWALFRRVLDDDDERLGVQAQFCARNTDPGDFSIILLDRVDAVEKMYDMCGFLHPGKVYMLHGEMKKSDRIAARDGFQKNGGILVANIKIAGRGFDIPMANKAFLFCPTKGESVIRQAIGRIVRWIPNKEATFFDWMDSSLAGQKRAKLKIYREFFPKANISER